MTDLTDAEYDALFASVLTITVTDAEVVVSSAKPPQTAIYRVERKPRLH